MTKDKQLQSRSWALDAARGGAVLAMVAYHFVFDLKTFSLGHVPSRIEELPAGFWRIVPACIATAFYLVAGISSWYRYEKVRHKFAPFLSTGLKLLAWGFAITLVSVFVTPETPIYFGTLHSLGVSIILVYFCLRYLERPLWTGLAVIVAGIFANQVDFPSPWSMWLGLAPNSYATADWFPVFPWFGVVACGAGLAKLRSKNRPVTSDIKRNRRIYLCWEFIGRHALVIYLLHQVVLVSAVRAWVYFLDPR